MKTKKGQIAEYLTLTPSDVEWAMMAAYIDGEGCIRIGLTPNKGTRTTRLLVVVSNNDARLMVWLKRCFGGHLYSSKSPNGKSLYHSWMVSHKHAEWILRGCLEFFVIKRDQAEMGLAHQQLVWKRNKGEPGGSNTESEPERLKCRDALSLLKGTSGWQKGEDGIRLRRAI